MFRAFRHFWPSIVQYKSWALATVISMTAGVLITAQYPFFIREIINEVGNAHGSVDRVYTMFFYIISLYILQFIAWRIFDVTIVQFESQVMRALDARCFTALQRQSIEFFTGNFSGSLVKRVTQFRHAFEGMADIALFQFGKNIILISFIVIIFFREKPLLGGMLLGWLILFFAITYVLSRWKYKYDTISADSDSEIGGFLADALGNQLTIKNWATETHEEVRFEKQLHVNLQKRLQAWNRSSVTIGVQALLMMSIETIILLILIRGWQEGTVNVGSFVFFNSYVLQLFGELWNLGNNVRRWFFLSADAEKMCEIFEQEVSVRDAELAIPLQFRMPTITFTDVIFHYPGSDENGALRGISFNIAAGESVGLVGESGSGKSTLIKVLMRYYNVTSGTICIGGQNIASATIQSVRQSISLVPQEAEMFHRTLFENIAAGKPNATIQEVEQAAKHAHAWEFISALPNGLQTIVGERGLKLSGGQRQRIALARAFLVNTPILVLDEATSALDSETEKHIQAAVTKLIQDRTSIIIAHRLSTVMQLDRIIVLENGDILEQGTHAELIAKGGKYASLWAHQTGGYIA